MKILVVEDEVRLAEALAQIMREQKYMVDAVYDGDDGLVYAQSGQYDVIVLDVMLPRLSGFEIARRLRQQKVITPVIMLTARSEVDDKVCGLDCGADDYLTKPFASEELLARIRALSRRPGEVVYDSIRFSDLTLDLSAAMLSKGEKSIHLSFKEFEIISILMRSPDAIVSKDTLLSRVWGSDSDAEDNNVEAYISFLRKKIQYLGSGAGINTVRKMGYKLQENRK